MNWTKEIPTESGFYWFRLEEDTPTIVEVDGVEFWVFGSECLWTKEDLETFKGEFWPVKLTPPQ